jgi:hypothetical protein
LGNDGPLPEIHFNGQVYPVGLPCPEVVATAESVVPAMALANLKGTQAFADPAEYAKDEARIKAAVRGKEYGFGRPLFAEVIGGADGNKVILWACLRLKTPGVTLKDVADMLRDETASVELEAALEVVAPAFFSTAAERMEAPPRDRQAMADTMAKQALASVLEQKLRRLTALASNSSPAP